MLGGVSAVDNQAAFVEGVLGANDNQAAYLFGTGLASSSVFAYLAGQVSSSTSAYMEGTMTYYNYIELTTSDSSLSKKFRVLAANYDDGSLEKAQSVTRTLGGGLDASMGAVFKTWNGTVRVRQTETETGYGDLEDLEYLYSLNSPNGTPSNVITFVDHHGQNWEVLMTGPFRKGNMSPIIQGTEAWFLVPIRLERIVNE